VNCSDEGFVLICRKSVHEAPALPSQLRTTLLHNL
jgi:hypothetical protein